MANEWTKVELYGQNNDGDPRRYDCASGVAISKGTLLKLTDPRTAAAHSAELDPIAGVAAMDKSATDLSTSISCWTNGIFEVTSSGAITIGKGFSASATANQIYMDEESTTYGALRPGYVLETTAAAETVNVRLQL